MMMPLRASWGSFPGLRALKSLLRRIKPAEKSYATARTETRRTGLEKETTLSWPVSNSQKENFVEFYFRKTF